jgi:hypothetical protein
MAKEKFLIVATRQMDDCFSRFSETANRAALDAGTANPDDAYSWIEATYNIELRRYREATHICSFTPSAYYVWLQNQFVGVPNAAWEYDGDPDGLEYENGSERDGYGTYRDEYPAEMVCDSFVIDTVKDLGIRKPAERISLSRRSDAQIDKLDAYQRAIWNQAEEIAQEAGRNGGYWADCLNVFNFRQRERLKTARHYVGESKGVDHARAT